jgi:hypothetical protein
VIDPWDQKGEYDMRTRILAGALMASGLVLVGSAWAEEHNLKFRLVVTDMSATDLEPANVPGRSIVVVKSTGVAVFDDGRIAKKDFVRYYDGTADAGDFSGYSTYTFENGDSITAKFVAAWSAEGVGGDYEVLSGTGAYEGATGTGRFDGTPVPWEGSELLTGTFKLQVPGS